MEKLEEIKRSEEERLAVVKANGETHEMPVSLEDLNSYRKTLIALLNDEADPEIRSQLIEKVVRRITVSNDGIEIEFHVGHNHYTRELALSASSRSSIQNLEKKRAVSEPLPKFFKNNGSNSSKIGGGGGSRTPVRERSEPRRLHA